MAAGRGLYSAGVGGFIVMADEDAMVKQARWKTTRPLAAQSWGQRCCWPSQSAECWFVMARAVCAPLKLGPGERPPS